MVFEEQCEWPKCEGEKTVMEVIDDALHKIWQIDTLSNAIKSMVTGQVSDDTDGPMPESLIWKALAMNEGLGVIKEKLHYTFNKISSSK